MLAVTRESLMLDVTVFGTSVSLVAGDAWLGRFLSVFALSPIAGFATRGDLIGMIGLACTGFAFLLERLDLAKTLFFLDMMLLPGTT